MPLCPNLALCAARDRAARYWSYRPGLRPRAGVREASLERLQGEIDRNWRQWVMIVWLAVTAWYLQERWGQIRWWSLGDTDDNIRLMQVRA